MKTTPITKYILPIIWIVALCISIYLGANILIRLVLAIVKYPFAFGSFFVLFSIKTLVFPLLVSAMAAIAAFCRRKGRTEWIWYGRGNALASAILLVIMMALALIEGMTSPGTQENRFGYHPPHGLNNQCSTSSGRPEIPDAEILTNSMGYRDQEWVVERQPNVRRVLLVGDSFVYGYGIKDQKDTLDNALESELVARTNQQWEVINVALLPSALPYYVDVLLRAGALAKPDVMVMSFLGRFDLEPIDVPMMKHGAPGVVLSLMYYFDIVYDSMKAGFYWTDLDLVSKAGDARDSLHRDFQSLVAFVEQTQTPLVIWEPLGTTTDFLSPYRGNPLLSFLELTMDRRTPAHFFPNDGHPTPEGNRFFATLLADRIQQVVSPQGNER